MIEIPLASTIIKYLLDKPITMRDYEVYDPQGFQMIKKFLVLPAKDCDLTFDGLKENGDEIEVNDHNKNEYVELKIQNELIESRKQQLESLKKGFFSIKPLVEIFTPLELYPSDLQLLLQGEGNFISSSSIKDVLYFRGFPNQSSTPNHLLQLLDQFSQEQLKKFLLFTTEQSKIPFGGLKNPNIYSPYPKDKITITHSNNIERYPVSHVCFYQLELPDYQNYETLTTKLLESIHQIQEFQLI